MKKIALYIPSMNGGGAERVMQTLANGLAEQGMKVDLILNVADGPYLKDVSTKVNIIELKTSRALTSILPLTRYIRESKPDAILSAMNYINIIALLAVKFSGIKTQVIISEHDNLSASLKNHKRPLFNSIIKALMFYYYRKADAIIAVSNGVAQDLANQLNLNTNKIITIYNPIITKNLIHNIKNPEPVYHDWLKNKTIPVVIAAGRLTQQKGFDKLIQAFSKARNQVDCRLIILGEGPLELSLRELISKLDLEENVELVGFVDNPYSWMLKSDLFVLSSVHEGFGNVLVEAMACGIPVISTDCPSGPSEILEGGKWGELVPVDDINSMSTAIVKVLTTPIDHIAHDLETRAFTFSLENSLKKYLEVINNGI